MDCHADIISQYVPMYPANEMLQGYPSIHRPSDRYELTHAYYNTIEEDEDVKRPMNSFLLWAKEMRQKFAKENPNLHNAEISKLLGKTWNSMTNDQKRPYVEDAERRRVTHMRTHPNYRYAPKKRKDKKGHRMMSPEVAVALHSTLFDMNKNNINCYGYLRRHMITTVDGGFDRQSNSMRKDSIQNGAPIDNSRPFTDNSRLSPNTDCQVTEVQSPTSTIKDQLDSNYSFLNEEEKRPRINLSYPPNNMNYNDYKCNDYNDYYKGILDNNSDTDGSETSSHLAYQPKEDEMLSPHSTCANNTYPESDELDKMIRNNKSDFIESDGNTNIIGNMNLEFTCLPNIKPIEEDIPNILQSLFDSNNSNNAPLSLSLFWSDDIGDLISE